MDGAGGLRRGVMGDDAATAPVATGAGDAPAVALAEAAAGSLAGVGVPAGAAGPGVEAAEA